MMFLVVTCARFFATLSSRRTTYVKPAGFVETEPGVSHIALRITCQATVMYLASLAVGTSNGVRF